MKTLQLKKFWLSMILGFGLGIIENEIGLGTLGWGLILGLILLVGGGLLGRRIWIWVILGLLATGAGYQYNAYMHHEANEGTIDYYVSVPEGVKLRGYVAEYADIRDGHTLINVETKSMELENEWKNVGGRVLITMPNYPEYGLGDWIEAQCVLQTPSNFADFDYRGYLAKQNIYTTCYYPRISALEAEELDGWEKYRTEMMAHLNYLREEMILGIERVFPGASGDFVKGILLGERQNIPEEIEDNFRITGVSHMLSISGMHVAILVGFLMLVLVGLPRWIRLIIIGAFLLVFTLLVGASASVMRASIMGTVALFAMTSYRQNNAISTLGFAGLMMLLINPKLLVYDVGFQLSFLAVLGIALFYQIFFGWLNKFLYKWIAGVLAMTLSAQILTLPIIAWNFGEISLISPLTNLLALPILPLIMLSGILGGVLGIFQVMVGKLGGFFGWLGVKYLFGLTWLLGGFEYSSIDLEVREIWWILGYYLLLGLGLLYCKCSSLNKGDGDGESKLGKCTKRSGS